MNICRHIPFYFVETYRLLLFVLVVARPPHHRHHHQHLRQLRQLRHHRVSPLSGIRKIICPVENNNDDVANGYRQVKLFFISFIGSFDIFSHYYGPSGGSPVEVNTYGWVTRRAEHTMFLIERTLKWCDKQTPLIFYA